MYVFRYIMDIYLILNIPVDTWLCSSESHDIDKFLASNWHNLSAEAYWVPPNPLTVGGWNPYPLMLGGWNQPIIQIFRPKTAFQNIFLIFNNAQKASCAKRSSLRCYSMVRTLSPNVLMTQTLTEIARHWAC